MRANALGRDNPLIAASATDGEPVAELGRFIEHGGFAAIFCRNRLMP
jgi:hypothetical protein